MAPMKQIDEVTQTCCEAPDDRVGRSALSDMLRALEDYELADAVEGTSGPALLRAAAALAAQTKLPVTARLLWAAHALIPRLAVPYAQSPLQFQHGFAAPIDAPGHVPPPDPLLDDLVNRPGRPGTPWVRPVYPTHRPRSGELTWGVVEPTTTTGTAPGRMSAAEIIARTFSNSIADGARKRPRASE